MASFIVDDLTFSTVNGVTTATLKIRTVTGNIACSPLTVAVRDYSENNFDFPGQNVTVTPTQQTFTFTKSAAALPPGTYDAWPTYYYAPQATWYNVYRRPLSVPSSGAGTRLGKPNAFWEDFTGASLDTTRWVLNSTSSYPNNGPDNPGDHKVDYFDNTKYAQSGGNAVFTAADAGFTISGFPQGGSLEAWKTAFITSEGASNGFQVQTGDYLEGKFLLPGNAGAWPALWTWRNGNNEIDVFEYHPDNPNLLEFNNHVNEAGTYYTNTTTVRPNTWVTIGTLLGATSCDWYVNGTKVWSDLTGVGNGWSSYINLNLSLSDGFYHPQPSGASFTFSTDYLGVWRG